MSQKKIFKCQSKKFMGSAKRHAYDFDGVVHKLMKKGEDIITPHRNPDHSKLKKHFTTNHLYLKPYLIKATLQKMRADIYAGIEIYIVSANSKSYQEPIFNLLQSLGILIPKKNILMTVYPKVKKLKQLKINKFYDDSPDNIITLYQEYQNKNLPDLEELIWVWPEKERFYDISLDKELIIFIKKGWDKKIKENKKIEGVRSLKTVRFSSL